MTRTQTAWLNNFAKIIDSVRKKIVTINVTEEETFSYALIRVFSRMVLTMCEVYTLLKNGYPEGAFVLSRQLYEGLVIMDYLSEHKDDSDMIERFFSDIRVSQLQMLLSYEGYISEDKLKPYREELKGIAEKFRDFYDTKKMRFSDYWWAKKGCSFSELTRNTKYPKNYMYKHMTKVAHMSGFNSTNYIGQSQNIIISSTHEGLEKPALFSMAILGDALYIFQRETGVDFSNIIDRIKILAEKLHRLEINI